MEVLRMKPYPALLAELLSRELSSLRRQKALTQEAMAEQLRISSRAYSDLERGKYTASAPTLMFLFSMLDAEAQAKPSMLRTTWSGFALYWSATSEYSRCDGFTSQCGLSAAR